MKYKKIALLFCFFALSLVVAQAKKPTLMLIPSDVWMNTNKFGEMDSKGYFVPDYKKAFQNDPYLLLVIGKINTLMAERGFPLKNLESEIKKIEQSSATFTAFAGAAPESPIEQLARMLKTDLILQITYTISQEGPKKSVVFNLQAVDAYNQSQVAGAQGVGTPSISADVPTLLQEAVLAHMDNFANSLQKYFDTLLEKGRESKLFVRVNKKAPQHLDSDISIGGEEKRLFDWIDDYLKANLKRYNIDSQEDDYTVDFTLTIPVLDAEGRAYTLNDFMTQFRRYLSSQLKLESKFSLKGLGEAYLLLEGPKKAEGVKK